MASNLTLIEPATSHVGSRMACLHGPDVTGITLCSATLGEDGKTEPPLGPLYIASILRHAGLEVDFRDFQLQPGAHGFSGAELAAFLRHHRSVVAFSCFVDMLPAVIDAARTLHQESPETMFLLGGPGPTASARRIIEQYPWIHGVVRGEGEETIGEWIRFLRGEVTGCIRGMCYRHSGQIYDGGERSRNFQIDALPLPAYELIDWSQYSQARIITTRGCAYRCSFCDVTKLWGNRSVYRSLDSTIAEIEMLRDRFGKSCIGIVDDTFVLNRERVRQFCKIMLERRVGVSWGCFGRINLMTPGLIELMAKAGCRAIFYGIDSGSQRVLDRTLKVVRVNDIMPVLQLSAALFDKVEASFIWGYPFESLEDFKQTIDLAGRASVLAPIVSVQIHMLSPLPLSPIYLENPDLLVEPEPEDQNWLLLPGLLLDKRSTLIRNLIHEAPDIYPGFFTFRTPAKAKKRRILERTMCALNRTIGCTLFDSNVAGLLKQDSPSLEQDLIAAENHMADRIGVGLALGFFRRVRRRDHPNEWPFEGIRGPRMVRERVESV